MKPRNWFKKSKGQSTPPIGTSVPVSTAATTSNTAASSSNPIPTASRANDEFTFEDVLQNTSTVCDVIRSVGEASELLAPLKAIFGALKIAADTAALVHKNGTDLQDVIEKLNRHKNLIEDELKELSNPDFSKSKDVQGLLGPLNAYTLNLRDLYDELDILKRRYEDNKRRSRLKGILKARSDQGKIAGYTLKLEDSFQQFMTSVTKFIARQTILLRQEVAAVREKMAEMNAQMTDQAAKDALSQLPYADARGDQHDNCLEGTREKLLESITNWAASGTPIFSLIDLAGTGKSTVAAHMTRKWERNGLLLARYFFSKPSTIIGKDLASTLAREIAEKAPSLRPIIVDALDKHPNFTACSIRDQLEWVVFTPLKSLDTTRILVIDALDEFSKDDRGVFLKHLFDFISSYPNGSCTLKLFLTSRPEDDILFRLREPRHANYIDEVNFQLRPEEHPRNEADIRLYAKALLNNLLSTQQIDQFIFGAKGLFIWASTAYVYLKDALDPSARFERLMKKGMTLEALYGEIVNGALRRVGDQRMILIKVLQATCVAREPLTIEMMDEILGLQSGVAGRVVMMLSSVLSDGNQGKPVHVLHPTFLEYLLDSPACPLGISSEGAEALVAAGCLSVCSNRLKYNICDIHHRQQYAPLNKNIQNLEMTLTERTTPALRYATVHGLFHVASSLHEQGVVDGLRVFFSSQLLNWIELMSLYGKVYSLIQSMQHLKIRIKESFELPENIVTPDDLGWCSQIYGMVQAFQVTIEDSALQVYFSALPFEPPTSHIARCYLPQFAASIPKVIRGARSPQSQSVVLCGHKSGVSCIAYAPGGHIIASGSWDRKIRLWDPATGAALTELTGHTKTIKSLAFSPDGKVLASGSHDRTVRIWDSNTQAAITTLNGHTGKITCLAFSPRGRVLASGSEDCTVRLWNYINGTAVGNITGHSATITCLAFSPDGEAIASGSDDGTVRLWYCNAQTGMTTSTAHTGPVRCLTFSPNGSMFASVSYDNTVRLWDPIAGAAVAELTGHISRVNCIIFSPNSKLLASGSCDNTVWFWDLDSGVVIAELTGHTNWVNCLAFSPDGKVFASGSDDKTVRLWDANTGAALAELTGHTSYILTLAFSPDSKRLVSGSDDKTLRLWESSIEVAAADLTDHSGWVNCITFSQDSTMIASGSSDGTVRIWDSATGAAIAKLNGHTDQVRCLAFSPDGKMLASGSRDKTVQLWDPRESTSAVELTGHSDTIRCLTFSPDSKMLASGSDDKTVRLWIPNTSQAVGDPLLHQYEAYSLEFRSQNGHLLLVTSDYKGPQTFWNVSSSPLTRHFGEEIQRSYLPPIPLLIHDHWESKWTHISTTGSFFQLPPYFSTRTFCSHQGLAAYGGYDGSVIILDCTHLI